jgi:Ca-activated chloride channel family protein
VKDCRIASPRTTTVLAPCLGLCLLISIPWFQARAQSPDAASARSMKVNVNMVLVPVTVTDALDRPVMGLDSRNFAIFQDDQQQEIRYFSTEDSPISIGLVLDLSKSMTNKFEIERDAVTEFFKNANAEDDYFVITFSNRPTLVADYTQSIAAIQASLGSQIPDGNTALFDAVSMAVARIRTSRYRRRALLIISDGGDNHSRHHLKEIRNLVRDSDIDVYAIGIFNTGLFQSIEESMGKKWLNRITGATGGETIAVSAASAPDAAALISREMRDHYVLGYWPNGPARGRRKITVQVIPAERSMPLHTHYKTAYVAAEVNADVPPATH